MPTIKLRAPEGVTMISHGGIEYEVKDGALDVPHPLIAAELRSHGFEAWRDTAVASDTAVEEMTREQLLAEAMRRAREKLDTMSVEDLRGALLADEDDKEAGADVAIEDIGKMSRKKLFAYLRSKHVAALPSHSNDQLRQMALEAHG